MMAVGDPRDNMMAVVWSISQPHHSHKFAPESNVHQKKNPAILIQDSEVIQ